MLPLSEEQLKRVHIPFTPARLSSSSNGYIFPTHLPDFLYYLDSLAIVIQASFVCSCCHSHVACQWFVVPSNMKSLKRVSVALDLHALISTEV